MFYAGMQLRYKFMRRKDPIGFTIVELLIVIVVIAILAAITIVAYNGIQQRSQTAKIDADLASLVKAIKGARVNADKPLREITFAGSTPSNTATTCMAKPANTDLAALSKTADTCWTVYLTSLQRISDASGVNVTNLVDPWGRPYMIDENEQENTALHGPCGAGKDTLGVYTRPLAGSWTYTNGRQVPFSIAGC